jgi:hypothetical protein
MGLGRLELPTSRLSGVRSNHLSYRPRLSFYGGGEMYQFIPKGVKQENSYTRVI